MTETKPPSEPFKPGTITEVIIRHDAWCDFLSHKGECNCDPEYETIVIGYAVNDGS